MQRPSGRRDGADGPDPLAPSLRLSPSVKRRSTKRRLSLSFGCKNHRGIHPGTKVSPPWGWEWAWLWRTLIQPPHPGQPPAQHILALSLGSRQLLPASLDSLQGLGTDPRPHCAEPGERSSQWLGLYGFHSAWVTSCAQQSRQSLTSTNTFQEASETATSQPPTEGWPRVTSTWQAQLGLTGPPGCWADEGGCGCPRGEVWKVSPS